MYLMERAPSARSIVIGKEVDYFCGNDYHRLQGQLKLPKTACKVVQKLKEG